MILPVVAVSWLAAIAAVALWDAPWWLPAGAALPFAAWFALRREWARLVIAVACGLAAFVGALRFADWRDAAPPDIARYLGQQIVVEGTIASEPDPGETWTSYDVTVERVQAGNEWADSNGRIRVTLGQYDEHLPGTRLQLTGTLKEPPFFPEFDYRSYLARHGVYATMSAPAVSVIESPPNWSVATQVTRFRLALDHSLQRALPEPEASLAGGIAFGRDGGIPDGLYNDFRDTGLAHIVAVSGSNVSLVSGLTFVLFIPLVGRRYAVVPATLAVGSYLLVAGLSASVVRAGIMAMVFLGGMYLGRQQSALSALGLAVIGMTLLQPSAAADIGFQLSLAATAGLVAFGPWVRASLDLHFRRGRLAAFVPGAVVQVLAMTLSATVATLPLTWVNFGRLSLVGTLANVVVEPVFVAAFGLSVAAAGAGLLSSGLAWLIGLAAYYPLAFVTWFAHAMASVEHAAIDLPEVDGTSAFAAYLMLGTLGWAAYAHLAPPVPVRAGRRVFERRVRLLGVASACCLATVAIIPVSLFPLANPGDLEMTVLAGDGDAVLFTTPGGRRVLVNGGPSSIATARELGAVLPHWERTIDALFVTQPQDEHAGGVPGLLDRYQVPRVFDSGPAAGKEAHALYLGHATRPSVLHRGDRYDLDGVTFEVLWPPRGFDTPASNDEALVLRVSYRGVRFLLPSNLGAASQQQILADAHAEVLVVPHHGANKTDAPFIQAVAPRVAVIPVGTGRFAPRPADEALTATWPAVLLRTDEHGRVTVSTDGQSLHWQTQR